MGKITVFAFLGLIIIGSLGWALGERSPYQQVAQQDSRFASANGSQGKSRIDANMLEGWMLHGETPYLLIDTRSAASFEQRHLFRAINREFDALYSLNNLRRLPRHKAIVIYGVNERENAKAVDILRLAGLTAFYLPGGSTSWASLPVSESAIGNSKDKTQMVVVEPDEPHKRPTAVPAKHGFNPQQQARMAEVTEQPLHLGMLSD